MSDLTDPTHALLAEFKRSAISPAEMAFAERAARELAWVDAVTRAWLSALGQSVGPLRLTHAARAALVCVQQARDGRTE